MRQAAAAGYGVAVLSRNPPPDGSMARAEGVEYFAADVTTGEGLAAALAGTDVVIDCLEGRTGKARKNFADGGARLLAAAQDAGVARAVLLSIINCDRNSFGYYASRAAKERVYQRSGLETIVLRTTQFHSLLASIFGAGAKLRILPVVKGARFQPMAPADVAAALLELALEPSVGVRTIGGPEVLDMAEFARQWKDATGSGARPVQIPLPGAMGEYLRAGLNLVPEKRRAGDTFSGWLAMNADTL